MTIGDRTRRGPGLGRAAGLLLLLLGVTLMHSVVFTAGHGHTMAATAQQMSEQQMSDMAPGRATVDRPIDAADPNPAEATPGYTGFRTVSATADPNCSGCGAEHAMHPCVFVLALLLTLNLVALGWSGARNRHPVTSVGPSWLLRRARPPPWTVHTLAELVILRI